MRERFPFRSIRWLSDGMLVLVYAVGAVLFWRNALPLSTSDLFHVQFAAYEWKIGTPENIYRSYQDDDWRQWHREWERVATVLQADMIDNEHFYPPFVSAVLAPVSDVPAWVWRDVMFLLNVILLFVMTYQILRLCSVRITWRTFAWFFAFVFISVPAMSAIRWGQIGFFLSVLTWAGLLAIRANQPLRAGTAIGLAACIKISPIGVLALPVLMGRWIAALTGAATLFIVFAVSWFVLGADIFQRWWTAVHFIGHHVWPNPLDQSLGGWFSRLILGHSIHDMPFQETSSIAWVRRVADLIFGIGTLLVLWWRRKNQIERDFPAAAGLLLCGILLSLPFSWNHYFLFLLPVLAWALHETHDVADKSVWRYLLWIVTFFVFMRFWHFYSDSWFGKVITGHFVIANLLFYAWLVHRVISPVRKAQDFDAKMVSAVV